jgi:uncharacterized protein (TIGR03435 family)
MLGERDQPVHVPRQQATRRLAEVVLLSHSSLNSTNSIAAPAASRKKSRAVHRWLVLLLIVVSALLRAQASEQEPLAFDVASVKSADAFAPRPGRLGSINVVVTSGRLVARNATAKDLIRDAYSLDDYQVFGGPAWMFSARFDVEAKAPGNTNRAQMLLMLQMLLKDRFKLAAHRESKELAVYALVLDKNGPKFHALDAVEQACYPMCVEPAPLNHLRERDVPSLARYLTRLGMDKPVIDKTGLTGTFKIELDVQKIMGAAIENGGPPTNENIVRATVDAMHDELGLKLAPIKSRVDVLVIDHVEKPSSD